MKSNFIVNGKVFKTVNDTKSWWCGIDNPEETINLIKEKKIKADIFTFMQRPPDFDPKYNYFFEWDNIAAIPISTYDNWWTNQIGFKARNKARKAEKKNVEIKIVPFDNNLIKGIKGIYDETPYRQGRPFHHYGKSLEDIKIQNSQYIDCSDIIGAYYKDELIGFIKLVYDENIGVASTMQIIAKNKHRDKAPTNAMISKAVKLCSEKNIKYLIYSKFIYGKKGEDSLAKFKRSNGFKQYNLPRYYIALNKKGYFAIKFSLHKGFFELLPKTVVVNLLKFRDKYYAKKAMS